MRQVILYIKDNDGNFQQTEMFSDESITITSKLQDARDITTGIITILIMVLIIE